MNDSMRETDTIDVVYQSISVRISCSSVGMGQPILFLHGWNHSSAVWKPVIERIGSAYKCIVMDLPGFGNSQPIPQSAVTLESYAGICAKVLEHVPESTPLLGIVGDSFGALVALTMMNRHGVPGRFLLLSGCPSEGLSPMLRASARIPAVSLGLKTLKRLSPSFARFVIRHLSLATVRRRHDVSEELVSAILQADPGTSQAVFRALVKLTDGSVVRPEGIEHVLVARGQYDRVVSRDTARRLAKTMSAVYEEIQDVGHTPMLEDPDRYANCINSLFCEAMS